MKSSRSKRMKADVTTAADNDDVDDDDDYEGNNKKVEEDNDSSVESDDDEFDVAKRKGKKSSKSKKEGKEKKDKLSETVKSALENAVTTGLAEGRLSLSEMKISMMMVPELCEYLVKIGSKMKILDLSNNRLTSNAAIKIFTSLKENNIWISDINLFHNALDDGCMKSIGQYIQHNPSLKSLKLSSNKIADEGIKDLSKTFVKDAALESLDISVNTGITNACVPHLVKIVEKSKIDDLDVSSIGMNTLNLLTIPLLENLMKNKREKLKIDNKCMNDNDMEKVCEYLKKHGCKTFNTIDFGYNKIREKGASMLLDTLKRLKATVKCIDFRRNDINNGFMAKLAQYANDSKHLETIDLQDNEITNLGIESFADVLDGNTTLKNVYLQSNKGLHEKCIPYLVKVIRTTDVEAINLASNSFETTEEISLHLRIKNQLKKKGKDFYLTNCDVNERVTSTFCFLAEKYGIENLESIQLNGNKTNSTNICEMLDMLRIRKAKLKRLTVSGNSLGDEFLKSFGELFKSSNTLTYVDLTRNDISDKGIDIISKYLSGNSILDELLLGQNIKITDKSIPTLTKMVESSSLKVLGLESTAITQHNKLVRALFTNIMKHGWSGFIYTRKEVNDEDVAQICELLKENQDNKLETLTLSNNKITPKGMSMLFTGLKDHAKRLTSLDVSSNALDLESIRALGELMQTSADLKKVDISSSSLSDQEIIELSSYLIGNTTLKKINLEYNSKATNNILPYLMDIAKASCITSFGYLSYYGADWNKKKELDKLLETPTDQREIPIMSTTKSAAKLS